MWGVLKGTLASKDTSRSRGGPPFPLGTVNSGLKADCACQMCYLASSFSLY